MAHFIGVFRAPNQRRALPCYSKQIMIHFPKLDVAGSIPVSRSIFSITYKHIPVCNYTENGVASFLGHLQRQEMKALGMI